MGAMTPEQLAEACAAEEAKLPSGGNQYLHLESVRSTLDGEFTAADLRAIADAMDRVAALAK